MKTSKKLQKKSLIKYCLFTGGKTIAWYDYDNGCPYFYQMGAWFRQHPTIEGKFTWCKKASDRPYADVEEKGKLSCFFI